MRRIGRRGRWRPPPGCARPAVSRIWRAFGLKPHQTQAFTLSPDPQLIDKVRDIVGLYLNPPDAAVVLCVDEKSQMLSREQLGFANEVRALNHEIGSAHSVV
jgi:hypothetical protein